MINAGLIKKSSGGKTKIIIILWDVGSCPGRPRGPSWV